MGTNIMYWHVTLVLSSAVRSPVLAALLREKAVKSLDKTEHPLILVPQQQ